MKNKIFCSVVILFLILPAMVSADFLGAFAVIGRAGLSFVNPEAAQAVNTIICVSNPILCAHGKIVGAVTGEIYQEIARQSPEAAMAIATYNQIDGYLQTGASIIQELKVDNNGYVTEGSIEFTQQSQIGNLVGKNIKIEDVTVSNARLTKNNGISAFTLKENGNLIIRERDPNTGQPSRGRNYNNIAAGGIIKLDENGQVIEADITSNERGSAISFADKVIEIPPDTRVTFKDGKIKVYGNDKTFSLSNFGSQKSARIKIIEGGEVTIAGNTVSGRSFEGENFKVFGLNGGYGRIVFSEEKIVQVGENTAATIKGIQHITSDKNLNIYYSKVFDPLQHKNEDYFVYGEDRVWLGGSGFTSKLRKGNEIFPEYIENMYDDSFVERDTSVEFRPRGGEIEVIKSSPEDAQLAFNIKTKGELDIKNGRWLLVGDNENMYAKIENEPEFSISYDMRVDYADNRENIKTYDLDIESSISADLSEGERVDIEYDLGTLRKEIGGYKGVLAKLEDPEYKEVAGLILRLDENNKEIKDKKWEKITTNEENAQVVSNEIKRLESESIRLNAALDDLEKDERYREIINAKRNIDSTEKLIVKKESMLKLNSKRQKGIFGQIIRTQNGDASVSYSEFIEGYPVIKNVGSRVYYSEEGKRLEKPELFEKGYDILGLPVVHRTQTCADTQIKLNLDWQMEKLKRKEIAAIKFPLANGGTLEYRQDGSYTLWDGNSIKRHRDKEFGASYDGWAANVMGYVNTGNLRETLSTVDSVDDIRPGDILTYNPNAQGYGHTSAIKEIIEIPPGSGVWYYREFAGSDPAIDPRIYPGLIKASDLERQLRFADIEIKRFSGTEEERPVMVAATE